ncbi:MULTISPECIES: CidA/LrgA family protein [Chromobacterium]|uniref:CidA/LrgA family protein n=2 Tax=Chromobacterium TaxID=535 RepID=A0ABS3GPY3_9NEIS|nr:MULTISPECIES: CidA/LrgA family protein [Chromobacterium]AXT45379.1 CidA/LrgA family protein [Chromobacterium rhizoryzae]MBK0416881.1 CidA/LrgA family protein [Chromobacterium haemolyticum]MBO0416994.1 CidA/LrgA family protein [Chromobacterium haemolyticum]MBO0501269.1 CidA/LrgA family protein [Chromobacterium haemolyticum]OQS37853.1 CidA/LrgA family protein [Chromobacterium haemolyticum]
MANPNLSAFKQVALTIGQVALLSVVWIAASQLSSHFLPAVPAGVLGMFLVLAALWLGWLPLAWCRSGARWLLAEMLLFFIPAVVAVIQYPDVIMAAGLRIVAVIVLSTLLVMAATSWVVDKCYRLEVALRWHGRQKQVKTHGA